MILEIVEQIEKDWNTPLHNKKEGFYCPFLLQCFFKKRVRNTNVKFNRLPEDVNEFWAHYESAELFKDVEYGQWGLEIFSPEKAKQYTRFFRREYSKYARKSDVIIGHFIGDSDLLLVSCDIYRNFGQIIVVPPLDDRPDWLIAAENFTDFLSQYSQNEGNKYWYSKLRK